MYLSLPPFFFTYLRYTLLLLCDAVAPLVEQFVATFFFASLLLFPSKLHEGKSGALRPPTIPSSTSVPKPLLADCSFTADTKTVI